MHSGIAMVSIRMVVFQRLWPRILSIRRPVPNSAMITANSDASSHTRGLSIGFSASGTPGSSPKTASPPRISRPDAAGSRPRK